MPQLRKYANAAARQTAYRARVQEQRRAQLAARGLPPLPAIPSIPGNARWRAAIAQAGQLLAMVIQEMRDYHDDRSDQWQEGERAEEFTDRMTALEEVLSGLEDLS